MSTLSVNNLSTLSGDDVYVKSSFAGGFSLRNKIINGGMAIDQRNAGASQTITAGAALAYTVDRWYAYCTGANVTGQRVAGSGDTEFRYQFTGAASVTKIGFAQRIEGDNIYDLNNGTATLSVDLANSLLTTVTWTAWYANTSDTFGTLASPTRTQIATGTFTVTSTVTRYSTQITIPSAATTGIEIEFSVGAQTSGIWTIGNVQLEKGSAATPFERRPIGLELSLCQRYYEVRRSASNALYTAFFAITAITTTTYRGNLVFVEKRAAPTITFSGSATFNGGVNPSSYGFQNITTNTALIAGNAGTTTVGFSSIILSNNNSTTSLSFDAEL